jgi:hypothetical protein
MTYKNAKTKQISIAAISIVMFSMMAAAAAPSVAFAQVPTDKGDSVSISKHIDTEELDTSEPISKHPQGMTEMATSTSSFIDLFEKHPTPALSLADKIDLQRYAFANERIGALLDEKDFTITSYGHTGNLKTDPGVWHTVINMEVDNKMISFKIDAETNEVLNIEVDEINKLSSPQHNGFVVDSYDGDQTINGLQMKSDAVYYTHESGAEFSALLLNAVKSGSNNADLCDKTADPTSYWAQVGYAYRSGGMDIVWTDTNKECIAQNMSITNPSAGNEMKFRIFIDDLQNRWTIYAYNVDTGASSTVTKIVSGSSTLKTKSPDNGIFFENHNTSTTNDWSDGFATDPNVNSAYYRKTTHTGWFFWDGEDKDVYCPTPEPSVESVISGTLSGSPHDITFDVSDIETNCEAD